MPAFLIDIEKMSSRDPVSIVNVVLCLMLLVSQAFLLWGLFEPHSLQKAVNSALEKIGLNRTKSEGRQIQPVEEETKEIKCPPKEEYWRDEDITEVSWKHDCNYPGNDIKVFSVGKRECGQRCRENAECRYFTQIGNMCHLKSHYTTKEELGFSTCGYVKARVSTFPKAVNRDWTINGQFSWSKECDFLGPDIKKEHSTTAAECGKLCVGDPECRYFALSDEGDCHLKGEPTTQTDFKGSQCGFVANRVSARFTTKRAEWESEKTDNGTVYWKHDCDFPSENIDQISSKDFECRERCLDNDDCRYFAWIDGTCYLKGNPSTEKKYIRPTCGFVKDVVPPPRKTEHENEKLAWDYNCDYTQVAYKEIYDTRPEQCGILCLEDTSPNGTKLCKAFSWFGNDRCFLKEQTGAYKQIYEPACGFVQQRVEKIRPN